MALFDFRGAARAHPVTPTLPDDASFAAAVRAVVTEHLPALLGEPLLTVAERPRSTADLLALDAAGLPVVVQVTPRLTAAGLLEALDTAGRAAGLTRADLAAKHPDGPDRFYAALRAFFDSVPVTRPGPSAPGTVRLVIVCADVEDSLLHALAFLRSGAARVEVLHVGMLAGRGGQRLVDVSPLQPEQAAARRAVESVLTGAITTVPLAAPGVPGQPRPAFGATAPPVAATTTPATTTPVTTTPATSTPSTTAPATTPQSTTPLTAAPPAASPVPAPPPAPAQVLPALHVVSVAASDAVYVPTFLDVPLAPAGLPERPADAPAQGEVSPILDLLAPPRDPAAVVGPVDAALSALASELDEPLPLVWLRHRRGERFEVVLHQDGSLHTEDGTRYADPTWAASAVSGGTASDGWRVWRVGDEGRTLAELRG